MVGKAVPHDTNPDRWVIKDEKSGGIIDSAKYEQGYTSAENAHRCFGWQVTRNIDDKGRYKEAGEP